MRNFYSEKYWKYIPSKQRNNNFPFIEYSLGWKKKVLKKENSYLHLRSEMHSILSTNSNFMGIGNLTNFSYHYTYSPEKSRKLILEAEGQYRTNFFQYQFAYIETGAALKFNKYEVSLHIRKPIAKNLSNPYLRHNDLEWLFAYGLKFYFSSE